MKKLFYIQDLEDLVRHLICPCFIISFPSKKKKMLIYLMDLNISKNKEALKHQNKYPTIFISLKDMKNSTFEEQIASFFKYH